MSEEQRTMTCLNLRSSSKEQLRLLIQPSNSVTKDNEIIERDSAIDIFDSETLDLLNGYRRVASSESSLSSDNESSFPSKNEKNQENSEGSMETLNISKAMVYIPYCLVLIAQSIYEYPSGIIWPILMLLVFSISDRILVQEITKQQRRNGESLFTIICLIVGVLTFMSLVEKVFPFFVNLKCKSLGNLLWRVTVTDLLIKLITVALKTFLTCLPAKILNFHERGKFYLWIEALSQCFRALVPVSSWIFYFMADYQGSYDFSTLLTFFYCIIKVHEISSRGNFLINASIKFRKTMIIGSTPSAEQLTNSTCPICHEFSFNPVLLGCSHIFCQSCITFWLDRDKNCPLCQTQVSENPEYKDGHTTHFMQLF